MFLNSKYQIIHLKNTMKYSQSIYLNGRTLLRTCPNGILKCVVQLIKQPLLDSSNYCLNSSSPRRQLGSADQVVVILFVPFVEKRKRILTRRWIYEGIMHPSSLDSFDQISPFIQVLVQIRDTWSKTSYIKNQYALVSTC